MSFVAIPGLIGPMLGPIAGGLIVGYFHWRVIFFVNMPIGLLGLYLVYRHLPDYREEHSRPLDLVGLILFGARDRAALVCAGGVWRAHAERPRHAGAGGDRLRVPRRIRAAVDPHHVSLAPARRCSASGPFARRSSGSFVTRLGIGGIPFLFPLLYQVGLGFTPIQSGLLMMPQAVAAMSLKMTMPGILRRLRVPPRPDLQHRDPRPPHRPVRNHRRADPGVADRRAGVRVRVLHLAAIHEHEHARLRRRHRGADQQRQHHRQHDAADVDQLRRGDGVAGHGLLHSGPLCTPPRRR